VKHICYIFEINDWPTIVGVEISYFTLLVYNIKFKIPQLVKKI
jgi:hypothetical protein